MIRDEEKYIYHNMDVEVNLEQVLNTFFEQEDWKRVIWLAKLLAEEVDCWEDEAKTNEVLDLFKKNKILNDLGVNDVLSREIDTHLASYKGKDKKILVEQLPIRDRLESLLTRFREDTLNGDTDDEMDIIAVCKEITRMFEKD